MRVDRGAISVVSPMTLVDQQLNKATIMPAALTTTITFLVSFGDIVTSCGENL